MRLMPESEFGRFFLPGPTEVHPEVLRAMVRPMIPHRGEAMTRLMQNIQPGLQATFGTARAVHVAACSATCLRTVSCDSRSIEMKGATCFERSMAT